MQILSQLDKAPLVFLCSELTILVQNTIGHAIVMHFRIPTGLLLKPPSDPLYGVYLMTLPIPKDWSNTRVQGRTQIKDIDP